jgi:ankyrin repeat protein
MRTHICVHALQKRDTALIQASARGQEEIVKLLMAAGADIFAQGQVP